jgi:hypothetical protein
MDNKKNKVYQVSENKLLIVFARPISEGAKKFARFVSIYKPKIKYVLVIFKLFEFLILKDG